MWAGSTPARELWQAALSRPEADWCATRTNFCRTLRNRGLPRHGPLIVPIRDSVWLANRVFAKWLRQGGVATVETLLLQDWVTIDGNVGVASVTQGADTWLDIADHEDLVFYLDVKQLTNGPVMNYETAPIREDRSFLPIVTPFTVATGVRADPALFAYALTPPARHVRWRITSSNTGLTFGVTFRIWLAGYSLG